MPDSQADVPCEPIAGLTVPEIARRYRVSEEKVRAWIRRGELAAINTVDQRCARPRFVIVPEALTAFERIRAAQTDVPKRRRRGNAPKGFVDFLPE